MDVRQRRRLFDQPALQSHCWLTVMDRLRLGAAACRTVKKTTLELRSLSPLWLRMRVGSCYGLPSVQECWREQYIYIYIYSAGCLSRQGLSLSLGLSLYPVVDKCTSVTRTSQTPFHCCAFRIESVSDIIRLQIDLELEDLHFDRWWRVGGASGTSQSAPRTEGRRPRGQCCWHGLETIKLELCFHTLLTTGLGCVVSSYKFHVEGDIVSQWQSFCLVCHCKCLRALILDIVSIRPSSLIFARTDKLVSSGVNFLLIVRKITQK